MEHFFQNVLTASFHGSIVILAVLALRLILRKAPKKFICWLWTLAGLRLLMPIPLESSFSLQPRSIPIPISLDLSAAALVLWGVIALVIASYSALSYFHLRRKVDDAVKIPGGWESDKIETAFVLGFIRPKIYIPSHMSKADRKQILAHERTHLDKGDHWIKVIGFLALSLHWFNPLVWVSYILLCKDIEMACDERVVQFMELDERKAYSSALLRCSTSKPHYAACPVAFGEVSVKYRIKSVLNYRKPSFWLSLLCLVAIAFVAVCLMTSPQNTVPMDPDEPLREISHEAPEAFAPAVLPAVDPNPDWGLEVIMDAASPTGGKVVYAIQERFMAASEHITMKDGVIDRWNGSAWESVPSLAGDTKLLGEYYLGFAQSRSSDMFYQEDELDWSLKYGPLDAGDYRLSMTIESDTDSAIFQTAFHIYREDLPKEEEAALTRCTLALATLKNEWGRTLTFSETDLNGEVTPVKALSVANGDYRIEHYLGQFVTSTAVTKEVPYQEVDWDAPFRLDQNRQFLFSKGRSVISQEEITFQSVWADYQGIIHRGTDTFCFCENGSLKSVQRTEQTMDERGNVTNENTIRLDVDYIHPNSTVNSGVQNYDIQDGFDAQNNSPWKVFFRVDDDYLNPSGGEIWLGVDAIGVSNYTTDGKYWLERKEGEYYTNKEWKRVGGEDKEASWGDETIPLVAQTSIRNIDWTADYGQLEPGVYRMGKRFYKGDESIIQYAEFAIYQTGGIYGEGAEEALARVDAAMEKLQSGSYRAEKYSRSYSPYAPGEILAEVIWRYHDTVVYDFYNDAGQYSHSAPDYPKDPNDDWHMNWWERGIGDSPYSSIYFAKGRSVISDREVRFAQAYSQDCVDEPCQIHTYLFDEQGNLTEYRIKYASSGSKDYDTRFVITDTPESEIQAWVTEKEAEQNR